MMKTLNQMLGEGRHTAIAVYVALALKAGKCEALTLSSADLRAWLPIGGQRNLRQHLRQLEEAQWIKREVVHQGRKKTIQIHFLIKPKIRGLSAGEGAVPGTPLCPAAPAAATKPPLKAEGADYRDYTEDVEL